MPQHLNPVKAVPGPGTVLRRVLQADAILTDMLLNRVPFNMISMLLALLIMNAVDGFELPLLRCQSSESRPLQAGGRSYTAKKLAEALGAAASRDSDPSKKALPVAFVLDNLLRDRNVGSIFRTSEALVAAGGVWTIGSTPLPTSQAVLDAAVGHNGVNAAMDDQVPHVHFHSAVEAIAVLQGAGVVVWACDVGADSVTLDEALSDHFAGSGDSSSRPGAIALVMGNERTGVSCRHLCDRTVFLPVFNDRALRVDVAACQAAFFVADRWGLAREPAAVARLGFLLGLTD